MHRFVAFDLEIMEAAEASIDALSAAALYGNGVFTTVAIYQGKPFLWEKHWRRLENDAARLGIELAHLSSDRVVTSLRELIGRNQAKRARARVTLFNERSTNLWPYDGKGKTSVLITTGDIRQRPNALRLTVSPYRVNSTSPLTGVKSCNYLENVQALTEARRRGFDEAVRLNERDELTAACMANLFWLKGDRLFSPDLATGCIAGTTREFIMQKFDCVETIAREDELYSADGVLLCSAGLGIAAVGSVNGRPLPLGNHPVYRTKAFQAADDNTAISAV
jgi:branched-chain amino acid aminotransferase